MCFFLFCSLVSLTGTSSDYLPPIRILRADNFEDIARLKGQSSFFTRQKAIFHRIVVEPGTHEDLQVNNIQNKHFQTVSKSPTIRTESNSHTQTSQQRVVVRVLECGSWRSWVWFLTVMWDLGALTHFYIILKLHIQCKILFGETVLNAYMYTHTYRYPHTQVYWLYPV